MPSRVAGTEQNHEGSERTRDYKIQKSELRTVQTEVPLLDKFEQPHRGHHRSGPSQRQLYHSGDFEFRQPERRIFEKQSFLYTEHGKQIEFADWEKCDLRCENRRRHICVSGPLEHQESGRRILHRRQ